MEITYGSVCSGIEAASVAWEPLEFKAKWFSEIEKFPCEVLKHHWPHVPNLGSMLTIKDKIELGAVEAPLILVGGTPCQAFSIAGKQLGLDDERGQLTLAYAELMNAIDIERGEGDECVCVWENVPGVLSDKGNAFGHFLGKLSGEDYALVPPGVKWANAGYVLGPQRAIAWRVMDAQYFGVAQRRRRVFLVASARKGFDPAKVLFELEGVRRDIAPSRETKQGTTSGFGKSIKSERKWPADIACTLNAAFGDKLGLEDQHVNGDCPLFVPVFSSNGIGSFREGVGPLRARTQDSHENLAVYCVHGTQDPCSSENLAFALGRNNGGENAIAVSLRGREGGATAELGGNISGCLRASSGGGDKPHVLTFAENTRAEIRLEGGDGSRTGCLSTGGGKPGQGTPTILQDLKIRRLTPTECERLQGFPDGHTLLSPKTPDGHRYKALGNSMAVPCMAWIGKRLKRELNHA